METQQANADYEAYKRHYVFVDKHTCLLGTQLLQLITEGKYSIVHLLATDDEKGNYKDSDNKPLTIADLFKVCEGKVQLLFLASDSNLNPSDTKQYVSDLYSRQKNTFGVIAVRKRRENFDRFLDKLVEKLAKGKKMVFAWYEIRPQDFDGPQPDEDLGPIALCFDLAIARSRLFARSRRDKR